MYGPQGTMKCSRKKFTWRQIAIQVISLSEYSRALLLQKLWINMHSVDGFIHTLALLIKNLECLEYMLEFRCVFDLFGRNILNRSSTHYYLANLASVILLLQTWHGLLNIIERAWVGSTELSLRSWCKRITYGGNKQQCEFRKKSQAHQKHVCDLRFIPRIPFFSEVKVMRTKHNCDLRFISTFPFFLPGAHPR